VGLGSAHLPTQDANNMFIDDYGPVLLILPRTQDHKLLMLCCYAASRWGREGIATSFAHEGEQLFLDDCMQWVTRCNRQHES
jgi:hypothetical protein